MKSSFQRVLFIFRLLHIKRDNVSACITILSLFHALSSMFSLFHSQSWRNVSREDTASVRITTCISLLQPILPTESEVSGKVGGNNTHIDTKLCFYILTSFTESQNGRGWKGPLWVI